MMKAALFVLCGAHSLGVLGLALSSVLLDGRSPLPWYVPTPPTRGILGAVALVSGALLTVMALLFPRLNSRGSPTPEGRARATRRLRRWWWFMVLGTAVPILLSLAVGAILPDDPGWLSAVLAFMIVPLMLAMLLGPWIAIYINWFQIGRVEVGSLFFERREDDSPPVRPWPPEPGQTEDRASESERP